MKLLLLLLIPALAFADADISAVIVQSQNQARDRAFRAYAEEARAQADYLRHLQVQDTFDRVNAARYGNVPVPNIYTSPYNTQNQNIGIGVMQGINQELLRELLK